MCAIMIKATIFLVTLIAELAAYEPTWKSLDSRPIPLWYDEAKFGIFMHWGLYSVPSASTEWFWYWWKHGGKTEGNYMKQNFKPDFEYQDFGPMFTTEFFDADEFARIIKASGAKLDHEQVRYETNDCTKAIVHSGELRDAIKKVGGVHFGAYFSQFAWYHPLFLADQANGYKTQDYVNTVSMPQMMEIINTYQPEVLWSDGDWMIGSDYWKSRDFLAWLYTNSSVKDTICVNDRFGKDTDGKHGDFFNHADKFNPGYLLPHKWENAMTVDSGSWGYRRLMTLGSVQKPIQLITQLVSTVRLTSKLRNSKGLDPRRIHNPQSMENTIVYLHFLQWPSDGVLKVAVLKLTAKTSISMLGYPSKSHKISFWSHPTKVFIKLNDMNWKLLPSTIAWTLKIEYLKDELKNPIPENFQNTLGRKIPKREKPPV